MILPVFAYGQPVLRKVADAITPDFPDLQNLIADMWETMYQSSGVGLAAPQIGRPIRLFVVDTVQIVEGFDEDDRREYPDEQPIKSVFINAQIEALDGELWAYNEGCLSIPKIREDVRRHQSVTLRFLDETFQERTQTFSGITARVILHEYDHIEGRLFIDHISPLKRRLIKKKLDDIASGKVRTDYRMSFAK